MQKHISGYYITDQEGLAAFQSLWSPTDPNLPLTLVALVPFDKALIVTDDTSITGRRLQHIDTAPFWKVVPLWRHPESNIFHEDHRRPLVPVGKTLLSGCWFPRQIIPIDCIKSPARIALERLA